MTMLESLPSLHFISLLLLCCVSPSSFLRVDDLVVGLVACLPRQIQAFTQFKNEFDARGCNHSDSLNGVWCDNSTGAVTKLRLRACLSGTLKPNSSLFGMHQLRFLDLSDNNFASSSLLPELGNLNKLEVLSLSSNGFFGQVPSSFNNLTMLSYLGLSQNELTGSFPFLRNLSKLSFLELSNNHFSGTLDFLFELHNLRSLNLGFNNFRSSLPSEIGNLQKLEVLSLSSNSFFGQVPPTISNLTLLARLFLGNNDFIGRFPLVQNLTNLYDLVLPNNHFTGTIPSSLFTMPSLQYLDLRENNLAGSIEIPNSSTSSSLKFLYLSNNHFDGKILEHISKLITLTHIFLSFLNISYPVDLSIFSSLKSLVHIDLSGNSILPASLNSNSSIPLSMEFLILSSCGIIEFPSILKTLQNLQHIDISNNGIKGKVPEWLWSLPRLNSVDLSNNSFNGFEGSAEVLVNSSVQILILASNSFEGAFPNLPLSIVSLSAWNNSFKGNIPQSLCNRSSLMVLDLSDNSFTGRIPQCLSNLTFLVIRKNSLEGSIPDVFYVGASLRTFDVGYNRLTGKLPRSLLNCSSLKFLSVEHNNINDTFPFWLKALPNLQVVVLRSNKLYGPISPPDNGPLGFPELSIFEISNNNFTGSLPSSYFVNWKAPSLQVNEDGSIYMGYRRENSFSITGYYIYQDSIDLKYKGLVMEQAKVLTSYSAIDFSGNKIEGEIPESIGLLKALIALNLSNNAFTGHIPLSLGNLTGLQSLDLSINQLSGTIPKELGSLSFLAYINVSHNQLTGKIPQGPQFTGQSKSSFEGNIALCGLPLQGSCFVPPTQEPKEEDEEEEEQILNWKAMVIGCGPGVLFGLAIGQVIASYKPEWLVKINRLVSFRFCS